MSNQDICYESRRGLFFFRFIHKLHLLIALCGLLLTVISCLLLCAPDAHAEDIGPIVATYQVKHKHTGSKDSGGGCYTVSKSGTRTYEEPCGGTLYYWGDEWGTSECTRCGASYYGNRSGEKCPHSETKTENYTYYERGCGKGPDTVVGEVTYTQNTTAWTKEVIASITFESDGMKVASSQPYIMDGERFDQNEFPITENGDYTFSLKVDSNSVVPSHTMHITNIDHYAPTVTSHSLHPSDWTTEDVTVSIDGIADIQPDGSDGCGLSDEPYSFDDGDTWTADGTNTYSENGRHSVLIRDRLGNIESYEFTIDNIDREAPRILTFEYDHTPNLKDVVIEVSCDDIMSDGRPGVGLDDAPYSYDGGESWTDEHTLQIFSAREIQFRVRDRLGNIATLDESVTNIDDHPPKVTHSISPSKWTNGKVRVTFDASDLNPDGSEGSGLPEDCFSYDSGETWTDNNVITMHKNGCIQVQVRDRNDNTAYYTMYVTNIDLRRPSVNASYTLSGDGESAILLSSASDAESGIDSGSYRWSGPESGGGSSFTVSTNGTYTVSVRDLAGNEASASVEVGDIDDDDDDDDDGKKTPKVIPPPPVKPVKPKLPRLTPDSPGDQPGPEVPPVIEEEVIEILPDAETSAPEETLRALDNSKPHKGLFDSLSDWWNSLKTWQKILLTILLILLFLGLKLLLLFLYRSVAIYNDLGDEAESTGIRRYRLLGYGLIHSDDGNYSLTVPESLWDKAQTTRFMFRFSLLFALFHKDEPVYFRFPEDIVRDGTIAYNVNILIR